jgi:hypothetical protein
MKNARKQDKKLALLATLLLLLAIPISLLGVNQVNDIRNRAQEDQPLIAFGSDLNSERFTRAYPGIPYSQEIEVTGDFAPISTLMLGCDAMVCGDICTSTTHSPPEGFGFAADGKTLYWEAPSSQGGTTSWPVTISAMVPNEDLESEEEYVCTAETFTLTFSAEQPDTPPVCSLHSSKSLGSVPLGTSPSLILEGADFDSGIAKAQISLTPEQGSAVTYEWEFPEKPETILLNKDSAPELATTPADTGTYTISGTVTDADGTTAECENQTQPQLNIVIPGDNGSPVFTTDPYTDSRPGTNIDVGSSYTYTVEAEDPNGDSIDYYVINNTGWLTFTLNSSSDGNFKGTFSGTPTAPGSYTVVIALNDGFHDHYSVQLWVINVNSPENDTPVVTIESPAGGDILQQNQQATVRWSVSDSNLITRFDVYVTTDPTQNSAWTPLITGLEYNYDSYIWNTGNIPVGTYYIVVQATDNQEPAGIGTGVSGAFGVGTAPVQPGPEEPEPEPGPEPEPEPPDIIDNYPVISSITPADKSETDDTTPLISADLTASDGETIDTGSVKLTLDDDDISALATLNRGGEPEGSIMYTPGQPLSPGSHKVSLTFDDSGEKTASKQWTFTITEEPEEEPYEEDDTITIFGVTLPKRTAYIVGIGIALFVLALLIPWLLFAAWKRSKDDDIDSGRPYGGTPPPSSNTGFMSSIAAQPQPTAPPAPAAVSPKPPSARPPQAPVQSTKPEPKVEPETVPAPPHEEITPQPQKPEKKEPIEKPPLTPASEPTEKPPLTPEPESTPQPQVPDETPTIWDDTSISSAATESTAMDKPSDASPEETTTPDTADAGEPTEDDLLAALQQISEEETAKIPESMRPPEPQPKPETTPENQQGQSPAEPQEKKSSKPHLKPSDLRNLLGNNNETPEDPDEDQFTIA